MKNLFKYWDNLKKELCNKYLMLFLDYDGTLAPIAEKPERANISKDVKELLKRLSKSSNCKVAIISGRALEDIKNMLGLKNIIYSGNHGLEIDGPKLKFRPFVPVRYVNILRRIKRDLENKLFFTKGVIVEDKGFSLSLHYRLAPEKQVPFIKTVFQDVTLVDWVCNKIEIKTGKKVLEVRPPVEWDKGKVVLWLLARQKVMVKNKQIVPIYIGDDITDEDAFEALKNKGITIFVGKPKKTKAQFYLNDTEEVARFLEAILNSISSGVL